MKIGVMGHYFVEWTGGFDFLRITLESLLAAADDSAEIHLILPLRGPRLSIRLFARRVRSLLLKRGPNYPSSETVLAACAELDKRIHLNVIDRGYGALTRFCRRAEIDVLLPSTYALPAKIGVPWIGYIADFQHKHLPHFFTEQERTLRDQHFTRILNAAPAIMMNSRTVAEDAARFYPGHSARCFAMPFSADVPRVEPSDLVQAKKRYGIDGQFFMVCNQFWFHKDHATSFRAFATLLRDRPHLTLVCTGEPSDPRDPQHVPRLLELAESLGMKSQLKVLGLIPKADQLGLMTGCVAVIQPSLSEGGPGGGAVFDAVGLGIRSIVSDIPVNLELKEPTVTFFKAGADEDLAAHMRQALEQAPHRFARETLATQGRKRRKQCGEVLFDAIRHTLQAEQPGGRPAA